MTTEATLKKIDTIVKQNPVVLFMKGTKDFPQCGFSAAVVAILDTLDVDFVDINVLEDDAIRQGVKKYSDWATLPQLYIKGEFVGGCDIVKELYASKQLQEQLANI